MSSHPGHIHRRSREPINHPSSVGRRVEHLRGEHEHVEHQLQPSSFQPSKAALSGIILLTCLAAPEFANLHPNDDTAWTIYLTAKEAANAAFCALVAWWLPRGAWRTMAAAVAALFLTQAVDEAFGANLFAGSKWEYPVAIAFLALIALAVKPSLRDERHEDQ